MRSGGGGGDSAAWNNHHNISRAVKYLFGFSCWHENTDLILTFVFIFEVLP